MSKHSDTTEDSTGEPLFLTHKAYHPYTPTTKKLFLINPGKTVFLDNQDTVQVA